MKTRHFDIVSAFLHRVINTDVYMQQLLGFCDGTNRVGLLKKCYGAAKVTKLTKVVITSSG